MMKYSRARLLAMQEPAPHPAPADRIAHLQEMRKEQMRLARSWKRAEVKNGKPTGWEMHLRSAQSLHDEIKQLQEQIKQESM